MPMPINSEAPEFILKGGWYRALLPAGVTPAGSLFDQNFTASNPRPSQARGFRTLLQVRESHREPPQTL